MRLIETDDEHQQDLEHIAEAYTNNADRIRALERSGVLNQYYFSEEEVRSLEA